MESKNKIIRWFGIQKNRAIALLPQVIIWAVSGAYLTWCRFYEIKIFNSIKFVHIASGMLIILIVLIVMYADYKRGYDCL